jgi:DNA repair protein RadA/Sms
MTPVLRRLADVETRPVSWLWRGYVPANKITLIEGDPGLGKSLLVADLLARVTTGRTMPDGSASDLPGPANVLLLTSEDDPSDMLRPRIGVAGADLSRVYLWEAVTTDQVTRMPLLPEDLGQMASIINEIDAKLVVIDPLSAYLSSRLDSWRDPDIRRALSPLALMAADLGVTIILLRHWTKSPGTDLLYRGLGSIGFAAAARSVLAVVRHPEDDNVRVLFGVKSNLGPRPPALAFEVAQVGMAPVIRWKGPVELASEDLAGAGRDPSPVRSAVLAYVKGAGRPVGSKEVAENLGLNINTARWHLHQAAKAGQLVRVGAGLYRPASGSDGTTHNGVVPNPVDDTTECGHRCYSCGGVLVEPPDWPGWLRCVSCSLWSRIDDPAYARRI